MLDTATISLIVGIVTSIIGISTFVSGMIGRAKQDGVLSANVEACVIGVSEIRKTLREMSCSNAVYNTKVDKLEVRVENLERKNLKD